MRNLWIGFALTVLTAACGTTTTKIKDLPPLAEGAPVQMFWEKPNLKYEEICSIKIDSNNSFFPGHTTKEDFQDAFEKEARKCGADGVIFLMLSGYRKGDVSALATGIKVLSKEATALSTDKVRAFSLAVQSHDVPAVEALLGTISKIADERAPSDDELVNSGLYVIALEGLTCDPKMTALLLNDYHARIRKYGLVYLNDTTKVDANIPYCQNAMAKSMPRIDEKLVADTILQSHNYYVALLNRMQTVKDFDKKAQAFHDLLVASAELIQKACKQSATDSTCILKKSFVDESTDLKKAKNRTIKRNAEDILKILI